MLPYEHITVGTFLLVLDLCGTFVFALSGAMAGIKKRLDLFGVLVVSFAAANAGGIVRDLLIGSVPPAGIRDWRYITVSFLAGIVAFYWSAIIERMHGSVLIFDAAGLGLFAVTGASKALAYHLSPLTAILLGVLTGVGGGVVRDILVAEVPSVLRSELYAIAALAGATVVVIGRMVHLQPGPMMLVGAVICFALRFMAIRRDWRLPTARVYGADSE